MGRAATASSGSRTDPVAIATVFPYWPRLAFLSDSSLMAMDLLCTGSDKQTVDTLLLPERSLVRRWSLLAIQQANPSTFMRHQYARHAAARMLAACCHWLESNGHRHLAAAMREQLKA
jgi:hypothetical protein